MRAKDWEAHHALLHKHDSAKFNRPTKRTEREAPVLQVFDQTAQLADLVILVGCGAVLATVIVLLVFGVLS